MSSLITIPPWCMDAPGPRTSVRLQKRAHRAHKICSNNNPGFQPWDQRRPGTREGPMGLSEGLRGPGRAWDSEEPAAPTHQLRLLVLLGSTDQQLLVREKALLKNQQDANPYCNGSISNIEDRPEKSKVVSTDSWNPLRISTRKQRKVKHIDHLTMQKGRVAATLR